MLLTQANSLCRPAPGMLFGYKLSDQIILMRLQKRVQNCTIVFYAAFMEFLMSLLPGEEENARCALGWNHAHSDRDVRMCTACQKADSKLSKRRSTSPAMRRDGRSRVHGAAARTGGE